MRPPTKRKPPANDRRSFLPSVVEPVMAFPTKPDPIGEDAEVLAATVRPMDVPPTVDLAADLATFLALLGKAEHFSHPIMERVVPNGVALPIGVLVAGDVGTFPAGQRGRNLGHVFRRFRLASQCRADPRAPRMMRADLGGGVAGMRAILFAPLPFRLAAPRTFIARRRNAARRYRSNSRPRPTMAVCLRGHKYICPWPYCLRG